MNRSALFLVFGISVLGVKGAIAADLKTTHINSNEQNLNPVAYSISKHVQAGGFVKINLASLCIDKDGNKLKYTVITKLPSRGQLSLIGADHDTMLPYGPTYHVYKKEVDPGGTKFDGAWLLVKYQPEKGFVGDDGFSYYVVNSNGQRSNLGEVKFNIQDKAPGPINSAPITRDLHVKAQVREPVHIDLNSLALDLDGESLKYRVITSDRRTFIITEHGIEQGYYFVNYLPLESGKENIVYYAADKNGTATSKGTISLDIEQKIDSERGVISLKRVIMYIKIKYMKTAVALLMLILLLIFYAANFNRGYLKRISEAIVGALIRYYFIFLLLVLNYAILIYHYDSISLPAIALDADAYVSIFNYFKEGILGYARPEHYQRVLIPYLASLIPVNDPVLAFKIINLLFMNLSVLSLYKLWRDLNIKTYLISFAFFGLFFHQLSVVRFFNFWPTSIDLPSIFFHTLLAYCILKNNYFLLLLVSPFAVLQREAFIYYTIILFLYKIFEYYWYGNKSSQNKRAIGLAFLSNLIQYAALLLPKLINPQEAGAQFTLVRIEYLIAPSFFGPAHEKLLIAIVAYFFIYGGLLLLALQVSSGAIVKNSFVDTLVIFSLLNFVISLAGPTNRSIILGFPFIMTLVLIHINDVARAQTCVAFLLSLPMMGLWIDYPSPASPILFDEAPLEYVALWGIYMVVSYWMIDFTGRWANGRRVASALRPVS